MSASSSSSSAVADADRAKQQVLSCEKEIAAIKAQLRTLPSGTTAPDGTDDVDTNSLTVAWIKTDGLPEAAEPVWKLQLSSPIEEAELKKVFDPLDAASTVVVFRDVELNQATLTVSGFDQDIPLGTSISYDVATLMMMKKDEKVSAEPIVAELPVAIMPSASTPPPTTTTTTTTLEEQVADGTIRVLEERDSSEMVLQLEAAVCTVTLRLTYQPSLKDQREELYERLNKASQKKAAAVDELRQVALAASRQQEQEMVARGGSTPNTKKPAIQAGFLNKKDAKNTKVSRLRSLYEKTFGPQSLLRLVFPVAKNYVIFFGVVTFFHFQGQQFALPPPV